MAPHYAPLATKAKNKVTGKERALLIARLKKITKRAMEGEAERRATSRRGAKLAKGRMWEDGITTGRLPITANQAIAMGERFIANVLNNDPIPEIQPINGADDDSAALIEGGIRTNIQREKLLSHLKSSMRVAFFSFPVFEYTYWDSTARNGIGDFRTRMVPADRCIVDNRQWFVRDMEFAGVRELATRARLCQLFPDMVDEIEAAMPSDGNAKPGIPEDPWKSGGAGGKSSGSLTRLVADNQGNFTGKTTIKQGGKPTANPLTEEITVEYVWLKDPKAVEVERPKVSSSGKPVTKHMRDEESGELLFDHEGWEMVQGERGPLYQPKLKARAEPVFTIDIELKYPNWRHIAWIPQDETILWDVNWDGPIPLWSVRTSYPFTEYWNEGQGLRLASLAIARNILYTIIFQRLKLSLGGTWLATHQSGLKRNKLTPEDGLVFYGKKIDNENVRQFPVQPLDIAYLQLLNQIENEMAKLVGLSDVQRGQSQGRVDSSAGYDKLIEQAGTAVVDAAQLVEESLRDYAEIAMWYMQNYYTHEHFVQVESEDGLTTWKQASRFAMVGEYGAFIETGSTQAHSETARRDQAKEGAQLGIYALPMLAKMGHFPQWRRALKQKMALIADPTKAALLGPAGAPPGKIPGGAAGGSTARNHHGPQRTLAK
jgi:hypothetical protein